MTLVTAALSGFLGGCTLLIGAAIALVVRVPRTVVAGVMAFGSGVLISTLAYELVGEAQRAGGLLPTASGFLIGAGLYVGADWALERAQGARPRAAARPATPGQPADHAAPGQLANPGRTSATPAPAATGGLVLAVGALIDGIPESLVLGLSAAGGISVPIVLAIALGNLPESLSSTAQLRAQGRSAWFVWRLWGGIALISTVAAVVGAATLSAAPEALTALVLAVAAGGLFAMVCNTMIPQAFTAEHRFTAVWATAGFLTAFSVHLAG